MTDRHSDARRLVTFGLAPKGIIAIGIFPMGVVSIGVVPMGVLTLGVVAMGVLNVCLVGMGVLVAAVHGMGLVMPGTIEREMRPLGGSGSKALQEPITRSVPKQQQPEALGEHEQPEP